MFQLIIEDQTINLKWGTRAMKILCDRMGIEIDGFLDVLAEIAAGKATVQQMFTLVENFLHAGYQYANNGEQVDENTVCEWIDKCGGMTKINQGQLVGYINYVISLTYNVSTPLPGEKQEKKNKGKTKRGMTS